MTDPRLPPRAPPSSQAPRSRFLAGEWGLALLALVLAVLVWAVVWGKISEPSRYAVMLEPRVPQGFVAFHEGDVEIALRGPRAELEEAGQKLGERVVAVFEALEPDEEWKLVTIGEGDRFQFPFPRRLVESVTARPPTVEIFAWKQTRVQFEAPEVSGVPLGIGYDVALRPRSYPVAGPAGKVGERIRPDDLDLGELFDGTEEHLPRGPVARTLAFDTWRRDPQARRYREEVELPPVEASFTFYYEDEKDLRNRIEFRHPAGFVVTPSAPDPDIEQGWYTGTFTGAQKDLAILADKANLDAWWYVVRIPESSLPAGDEKPTLALPIEYVHTQALDGLRVEYQEGSTIFVVISRLP